MMTDIATFLEMQAPAATVLPSIAAPVSGTPRNTILHGDCLDVLPQLPTESIDFVLTDPPYMVRYCCRDGRHVPNDDNDAWLKRAFTEIYRVLARNSFAVSFYGWPYADKFVAAWRAAGFLIVGHFVFPKRYRVIDAACALSTRMRLSAREGRPQAASHCHR